MPWLHELDTNQQREESERREPRISDRTLAATALGSLGIADIVSTPFVTTYFEFTGSLDPDTVRTAMFLSGVVLIGAGIAAAIHERLQKNSNTDE